MARYLPTKDSPLLDPASADEARRWLHDGLAMVRRGDGKTARGELERARRAFEAGQDRLGTARAEAGLGAAARLMGDPARALEHSRRARDTLRALGADASVGELEVALTQLVRGDGSPARITLERLSGAPDPRVARIASCAMLCCIASDRIAWTRWLSRTQELDTGDDLEIDLAWPLEWAAGAAAQSGGRDRAREAYELAEARYAALGDEESRARVAQQLEQLTA